MGKFYGQVGYAISVEQQYEGQGTGVFDDSVIERPYYGDVIRRSAKWQNSGYVQDDLKIVEDISIIADPYAFANFSRIKYVVYMGVAWKVTSIDVQRPRLILSMGEEWNGNRPTPSPASEEA